MDTLHLEVNGLTIDIAADSEGELVDGLQESNLQHLLYDNYYFSPNKFKKTGDGWIPLAEMDVSYVLNAYLARFSEYVRVQFKNDLTNSEIPAVDLYTYVNLINSLNDILSIYIEADQPILSVLDGLNKALDKKVTELNDQELEFDDEEDDRVDRAIANAFKNAGIWSMDHSYRGSQVDGADSLIVTPTVEDDYN